jgi:hypothetical protein
MKQLLLALVLTIIGPSIARSEDTSIKEAKLAQEALQKLLTAKEFSVGGVGESGARSSTELSFRALLKRTDALAQCQKLLADASPAGKLYGLLGLKILDANSFRAALPGVNQSKTQVTTIVGCITFNTTVEEIADEIKRGKIE